jgi:hypothetical protein
MALDPKHIVDNISLYLFNKSDYTQILNGNILIGKGQHLDEYFEIRYVYNISIYKQILIDDIWSEDLVWDKSLRGVRNSKKSVYYLCHPNIDVTRNYIVIDKELIISKYFESISKYFLNIDYSTLKKINDNIESVVDICKNKNKEKSIISIVTTVFNNSKQLEQTIQSVINQKYSDYEYIIKDACSTDDIEEVLSTYSAYVDLSVSTIDNGIYFGMDEGIGLSSGQYINCLNSDDIYYSPDILSTYHKYIIEDNADAFYSNILFYNRNGSFKIRKGIKENIYRESSINHPSLFLRKQSYYAVGGFDFSLKSAADGDLTIKLIKAKYDFTHINIISVIFRLGGASSFKLSQIKESIICRYRYDVFNFKGYIYVLLKYIKSIIMLIFRGE